MAVDNVLNRIDVEDHVKHQDPETMEVLEGISGHALHVGHSLEIVNLGIGNVCVHKSGANIQVDGKTMAPEDRQEIGAVGSERAEEVANMKGKDYDDAVAKAA